MAHTPETLNQAAKVEVIAAGGLGFGSGGISVEAQKARGEVDQRSLDRAEHIILEEPSTFVPVDADAKDDGCGDGRPTNAIYRVVDGVKQFFGRSRSRAKLFGGGLVAASSMLRTVLGRPAADETVLRDRTYMAKQLRYRGVQFGAHTDNHPQGENCGCGAIDHYPKITGNIIEQRAPITKTLQSLYGDQYEQHSEYIETVFDRYKALAKAEGYFADASGTKTRELLENEGAVIKELGDEHLEDVIVLNDVAGTTFSQPELDRLMHEQGGDDIKTVQAFVVDIWRGKQYAEHVANIAVESGWSDEQWPDTREAARQLAYADFLIRTLATAGTLTAGDQRVYGRYDPRRVAIGQKNFALAS